MSVMVAVVVDAGDVAGVEAGAATAVVDVGLFDLTRFRSVPMGERDRCCFLICCSIVLFGCAQVFDG